MAQLWRLRESGKRGPDNAVLLQGTQPGQGVEGPSLHSLLTHSFFGSQDRGVGGRLGQNDSKPGALTSLAPSAGQGPGLFPTLRSARERGCGRPSCKACARSWRKRGLKDASEEVKKGTWSNPRSIKAFKKIIPYLCGFLNTSTRMSSFFLCPSSHECTSLKCHDLVMIVVRGLVLVWLIALRSSH